MDPLALGVFLVSATALLGSPGPGIAALVTVGRTEGFSRGLRYYAGLQIGLAAAAGISAAGLVSVLKAFPAAMATLTLVATAYLVYLACRIATLPVGSAPIGSAPQGSALEGERTSSSAMAGLLLGIANPKAFVAFASLFASRNVVADPQADVLLKWMLCVAVMLAVDLAWLLVGVAMNRATLRPAAERALNLCLGAMILGAAALAFV